MGNISYICMMRIEVSALINMTVRVALHRNHLIIANNIKL